MTTLSDDQGKRVDVQAGARIGKETRAAPGKIAGPAALGTAAARVMTGGVVVERP